MTKQPNPSGPSLPRTEYGAASSSSSPREPEPVAVPKLKTMAPRKRRSEAKKRSQRTAPDPPTDASKLVNPFAGLPGRDPVDPDDLRQTVLPGQPPESEIPSRTLGELIQRKSFPVAAFLISVIAHLVLFLVLALSVLSLRQPDPKISFLASIVETSLPEDPADVSSEVVQIELPDDSQSPVEMAFEETSNEEQLSLAESSEVIPNVVTEDVSPAPNQLENSSVPVATLPAGGGLDGRELSARARLAASRGGSRASEMAVELGLKWLFAHQFEDGSWHFHHDGGACNGECRNQGTQESTTAATGLALLSFLGAGYTHRVGPYQETVQKGLDYLRWKMRVSKNGGSLIQGEAGMYSHAIATLALSEAYILTRDTDLIRPIIEARKYIENAQHSKGGWRYIPGSKGDMTVTGWQLMALKSCQLAGFETGKVTWDLADQFINSVGSSSGRYGYQKPDEKNPTTTAVGILSKMYLGASKESLDLGTEYLIDKGPSKTDIYFDYYATQVLHHRRDTHWQKWNEEMRDYLINTQEIGDTHRAGSWYFPDPHGMVGGRLYTTAMAVMTLEVYYRYMPLYDKQAIK